MRNSANQKMNHQEYYKRKVYAELEVAEKEIKEGKTRDTFEALKEMREKYGI